MPTRRLFLATLVAAAAFAAQPARAQGNGNGNGGGGNGNGGNGNAGNGNGGNGNGGNGNGGGNGNPAGTGAGAAAETDEGMNAPSGLSLRHSNGFEEEIDAGRYEMRDNQGRRIVSRAARTADYLRLYRLIGP